MIKRLLLAALVALGIGVAPAGAQTTSFAPTGDDYLDAMFTGGIKWTSPELTISFPTDGSFYDGYNPPNYPSVSFAAFSASQRTAMLDGAAAYAKISGLVFTELTESASLHAVLRYGFSGGSFGGQAIGHSPSNQPSGGDAWFHPGLWNNPQHVGTYARIEFWHEMGHTLGLKHPHVGPFAGALGSFPKMPADGDAMQFTVMAYRTYVGDPDIDSISAADDSYPQTLMMYDIAAIQFMYGTNFSQEGNPVTYAWSPTTGEYSINGTGQGVPKNSSGTNSNKVFMTIWDGSGVATYDFSAFSTNMTVNLAPGTWTTTDSAQLANLNGVGGGEFPPGNIANGLCTGDARCLIRNVVLGAGNNTVNGNTANNTITSQNTGSNSITGGGGTDTVVYSGNRSSFTVTGNTTSSTVGKPGGATDTLAAVRFVQFDNLTCDMDVGCGEVGTGWRPRRAANDNHVAARISNVTPITSSTPPALNRNHRTQRIHSCRRRLLRSAA